MHVALGCVQQAEHAWPVRMQNGTLACSMSLTLTHAVHHFLHGRAPCEDAEAAGAVEQLSGEDAEEDTALPAWGYAACSAGSAAVAAVCTQPLDVVKTRLQVHFSGLWPCAAFSALDFSAFLQVVVWSLSPTIFNAFESYCQDVHLNAPAVEPSRP